MYIDKINFDKDLILKLIELKLLSIISCRKINNRIFQMELKALDLSENIISDINILEKVNFKELNKLNLNSKKISDINIIYFIQK